MLRKKILILRSDYLINAGVLSFLADFDDFEVIGLESDDADQIFQEIERLQPDVIISDQNDHIQQISDKLSLLEGLPYMRLIIIDITDNQVQVCDLCQVPIRRPTDLIRVLQ